MAASPLKRSLALLLAAAVTLAGCSPDAAEKKADSAAPEAKRPLPSQLQAARQTLGAEDIEGAALAGELACSFAENGAAGPLLVAMADVTDAARAEGVFKLGPSALRLQAAQTGGFNAMVNGARFTSGDLAVQVVVLSGTPLDNSESPPLPARLEIVSKAGTQRIDGEWTCGP